MRLAESNFEEWILSPKDFLGKSKDRTVEDDSLKTDIERQLLDKVNKYNNLVYWFGDGGINWGDFKTKINTSLKKLEWKKRDLLEVIFKRMDYKNMGSMYEGLDGIVSYILRLNDNEISSIVDKINKLENIGWKELEGIYKMGTDYESIGSSKEDLYDIENFEDFEKEIREIFDNLAIKINLPPYGKYYDQFLKVVLEELKTYSPEQRKAFLEISKEGIANFANTADQVDEISSFYRQSSLGSQTRLWLANAKHSTEKPTGNTRETIVATAGEEEGSYDKLGEDLRIYWYKHYIGSQFGNVYDGTSMMEIIENIWKAQEFEVLDFFDPVTLKWLGDFELYLSSMEGYWDNGEDKDGLMQQRILGAVYATFPMQMDSSFIKLFVGKLKREDDNFKNSFFATLNDISNKKTGIVLESQQLESYLYPLLSGGDSYKFVTDIVEISWGFFPESEANRVERKLEAEKKQRFKNIYRFLGVDFLAEKDKAKIVQLLDDMNYEEIKQLDYLIKMSLGEALFDSLESWGDMADWLADNIVDIHERFFEYFVGSLANSEGNLKKLWEMLFKDSSQGMLNIILDEDYVRSNFLDYLKDPKNLKEIKILMAAKALTLEDSPTVRANFIKFAEDKNELTSKDILKAYIEALVWKGLNSDESLLVYVISNLNSDKSNLKQLFVDYRRRADADLRHWWKEMGGEDIEKYIFENHGEEFELLKADISVVNPEYLKLSNSSLASKINAFVNNEWFKKINELDEIQQAADKVQANWNFYVERINATQLEHVQQLKEQGRASETLNYYEDSIQASMKINNEWPQDFDDVPLTNIDLDYISGDWWVKVVVKDPTRKETLMIAKGSDMSEANKNLLAQWAHKIVNLWEMVWRPDDFAQKFKIDLSNNKLSSESLKWFTAKLSRYVVEGIDQVLNSPEGKEAFDKLPFDQKSQFVNLYEETINNPFKAIDLIEYINTMVSKYNNKTNFFWRVRVALQTEPTKNVIDLGRIEFGDYSNYQTNKFFERKRDRLAQTQAVVWTNKIETFFRSLSNS